MKAKLYILIASMILGAACEKRKFQENLVGDWMTYEIVHQDGRITTEKDLYAYSVFGIHAPGIRFNNDKTFVPFYEDGDDKVMKDEEGGKYQYTKKSSELYMTGGVVDMLFTVDQPGYEHIWLKRSLNGDILKLKKLYAENSK